MYANWQIRSWNTLRLLTLDVRITSGIKSGCMIRTFWQPVSQRAKGDYVSLTWERRGVDGGLENEVSLKYALGERRGTLAITERFFSRTFLERWASNLSTTTQPSAKLSSATRRCLHCLRCWMAILIFLGDGRKSLFRTLHNGQTWSSGVRLSCSYETAGMWRELINRLLVWFPQDVTKKRELTLVYR